MTGKAVARKFQALSRWLFCWSWILGGWDVAGAANSELWHRDFAQALNDAERLQRPVLIHFFGSYCPPCQRMEREVFATREAQELLRTRVVGVKIDAGQAGNEQARRLVQRFSIYSLPSEIILDPLSGQVLSQTQGFQTLATWQNTLMQACRQFDLSQKTRVARSTPPANPSPAPPSSPQPAPSSPDLGEPQPWVGLEGYSPVALGLRREWVKGSPEFSYEYKGITYYLVNREELALFREHPEDYAPRLLGCDPVVLLEQERAVPGDTRYGAYYDGQLFLFISAESRARFKAHPQKYLKIQHVLRADQIERVARVVTGSALTDEVVR
ncbi:MAG: hypothetical protein KatS3mg114_1351 [Planctomycetaceae bacterium]|nr:MAG: hypothetical protein KatS3mg114_1351 [Planctomycetaceae bacterium]